MNRRFEGWQLALILLIPLAIIAAAVWIGIDALSDDNQPVSVADGVADSTDGAPTPTPVESTEALVLPTSIAAPTPVVIPSAEPTAIPTPTVAPTAAPAPTATTGPVATAVPVPTTPPGPTSTPGGPAPTATSDPSILTISCSAPSAFPTELEVGETFGPLTAVTSPAEAAANMSFQWNFGNSTIAAAPQTGLVSYDASGSYTVTLTGTDSVTSTNVSATCGTITVGEPVAAIVARCTVAPADATVKFKDAKAGDPMVVTVRWTPASTPLTLQYDFGGVEPIVFAEGVVSGNSKTHFWPNEDAEFKIFWRDLESGATGLLNCPAYPPSTP